MSAKVTLPSRSLLQGMPYTNSASTDIKATFARIRAEQQPKGKNVAQLRKRTK